MKIIHSVAVTLGLALMSGPVLARDGSDNMSSACATLEFMAKMVALNLMLPADRDNLAELQAVNRELLAMNSLVCQAAILTEDSRGRSRYANGRLVSSDLYYDAWYFSNGQVFMLAPGEDTTIFYPNGVPMAYHWMHGDDAIFWPNSALATNRFRAFDVTWHYPNGSIITYQAGYQGGRWFYPFPRLDGGIGQEVLSSEWGMRDERFSFLNFRPDGSVYITRERIRRKLIFDDIDLLDVPGVLLLVTRLYQQTDTARQFVPADANITGAPF